MKKKCWNCRGDAMLCNVCGEREVYCLCMEDGDDPELAPCSTCDGAGKLEENHDES